MAIYKNREVSILGPNNMANSPESINVSYKDGAHENVTVTEVYFTQEEKDSLVKRYPSKYTDVNVISSKDIEAVRQGKTPSFDPSYSEPEATEPNIALELALDSE